MREKKGSGPMRECGKEKKHCWNWIIKPWENWQGVDIDSINGRTCAWWACDNMTGATFVESRNTTMKLEWILPKEKNAFK